MAGKEMSDLGFTLLDGANARIKSLEASIEPLRVENEELRQYLVRMVQAMQSSHKLFFGFIEDIQGKYGKDGD
jgi:hypothetical protein